MSAQATQQQYRFEHAYRFQRNANGTVGLDLAAQERGQVTQPAHSLQHAAWRSTGRHTRLQHAVSTQSQYTVTAVRLRDGARAPSAYGAQQRCTTHAATSLSATPSQALMGLRRSAATPRILEPPTPPPAPPSACRVTHGASCRVTVSSGAHNIAGMQRDTCLHSHTRTHCYCTRRHSVAGTHRGCGVRARAVVRKRGAVLVPA